MFTYKEEEFRIENSGWWVVAYSKFVARKLAFSFFEPYENLCVWAVSRDTSRLARDLNLEPIPGSMENVV